MPAKTTLRFELTIQAPVAQVFRAFTNKVGFEEWLCDSASINPNANGRFYLSWNVGYYAAGHFVEIKPLKRIKFTWRGTNDPAETLVTVNLKKDGASTQLSLVHSGIWESKKWAAAEEEIKKGWVSGLRNLSAILEHGPDPRITTRPMLGVFLGNSDPESLKKAGVPVLTGVRLEGVVNGLGAQKCGLQGNDVIVQIDDVAVQTIGDIGKAMQGRIAGEILNVKFYRGKALKTADMQLAPRPTIPLPASAAEFAQAMRIKYTSTDQELFPLLHSLSEELALRKFNPSEWNTKEILAHLIHCERDLQLIIHKATTSDSSDFSDNTPARIQATLRAYPSTAELAAEFQRAEQETLAYLDALPSDFTSRKGSFWSLANAVINFNDHTREHLEQIKKTIAS